MKVIRSEPQRSERGKTLGALSERIEGLGTRLADMQTALQQQTLRSPCLARDGSRYLENCRPGPVCAGYISWLQQVFCLLAGLNSL